MSLPFCDIRVAASDEYAYSNTLVGDLVLNLSNSNNAIHLGYASSQKLSLLTVSSNNTRFSTNLGIQKDNPTFPLDVTGDINITGIIRKNGNPLIQSQWSNNLANVFLLSSNVGIGTSSPAHNLDVLGNSRTFNTIDGAVLNIATNKSATINAYSAFQCFNDFGNGLIMFQNSSARTADGGVKTATIRNDQGDLCLQAMGQLGMQIKQTTGYVGIGTATPVSALDVSGNISTNSTTRIDTVGQLSNVTITSSTNNINAACITSGTLGVARGGTGAATFTANKVLVGNSTNALLQPTNLHWDDTNIRLGISNITPAYPLDVTGDINITGIIRKSGNPLIMSQWSNNAANVFLLSSNVGIGTSAPASTLDVNGIISTGGAIRLGSGGQLSNVSISSTTNSINAACVTSGILPVSQGGTGSNNLLANKLLVGNGTSTISAVTNLHWDSVNNKLGINKPNPTYALDVTGDIYATGDIGAFSDIRVKGDLQKVADAVSKLKTISGYTYQRIDRPDVTHRNMGLIAQEVEQIAPELIYQDQNAFKGISYFGMSALFVEAIKELSDKVDSIMNTLACNK